MLRNTIRKFLGTSPYKSCNSFRSFSSGDSLVHSNLSNNLRIISYSHPSPISNIAIAIKCAPRYEIDEFEGCSQLVSKMILKSNKINSTMELLQKMNKFGTRLSCFLSREYMMISTSVLSSYVSNVLELISHCIKYPHFLEEEIVTEIDYLKLLYEDNDRNIESIMMDEFYKCAYGNKSIGRPLHPSINTLSKIKSAALQKYISKCFTPSNIIITGTGIDHNSLHNYSNKFFHDLRNDSHYKIDEINYIGGESKTNIKLSSINDFTHYIMAFHYRALDIKETAVLYVLSTLLGGGASFSSGGPGKGMYSRLNLNVLNRYSSINSLKTLSQSSISSSMFGFYGQSEPTAFAITLLMRAIVEESYKLLNTITDLELNRSKRMFKLTYLSNLEYPSTILEDIVSQFLVLEKFFSNSSGRYSIEDMKLMKYAI